MVLDSLFGALALLSTWLDRMRVDRHRNDEQLEAALITLQRAVVATQTYLADTSGRQQVEREREEKLAQLWAEAAVRVRHVDVVLADTCGIKRDYWIDPASFSAGHTEEARIRIDRVAREIEALRRAKRP